jgi:hypothetical protein
LEDIYIKEIKKGQWVGKEAQELTLACLDESNIAPGLAFSIGHRGIHGFGWNIDVAAYFLCPSFYVHLYGAKKMIDIYIILCV